MALMLILAGCPGRGDRLKADETTVVSKQGEDVCFFVPDAKNYQPTLISINPRGTLPQNLSVIDSPKLSIRNNALCIPPEFYEFPDKGQYIVQFILKIPGDWDSVRSVVTSIEFTGKSVKTIHLSDSEILR